MPPSRRAISIWQQDVQLALNNRPERPTLQPILNDSRRVQNTPKTNELATEQAKSTQKSTLSFWMADDNEEATTPRRKKSNIHKELLDVPVQSVYYQDPKNMSDVSDALYKEVKGICSGNIPRLRNIPWVARCRLSLTDIEVEQQVVAERKGGEGTTREDANDKTSAKLLMDDVHEAFSVRDISMLINTAAAEGLNDAEWHHAQRWLLDMASRTREGVKISDITTNHILYPYHPRSLDESTNRMLDFAIALDPTPDMLEQIEEALEGLPKNKQSVNALGGALAKFPIGVHVLARRSGAVGDGQNQVGIVALAAWSRLNELIEGPEEVIELPFIIAEGSHWFLSFAQTYNDTVGKRRMRVYRTCELGNTTTAALTYHLLGVLRVICGWVDTQFRKWFSEKVLRS